MERTDQKPAFTGFFDSKNQPIMVGDMLMPVEQKNKRKNFNGKGRK